MILEPDQVDLIRIGPAERIDRFDGIECFSGRAEDVIGSAADRISDRFHPRPRLTHLGQVDQRVVQRLASSQREHHGVAVSGLVAILPGAVDRVQRDRPGGILGEELQVPVLLLRLDPRLPKHRISIPQGSHQDLLHADIGQCQCVGQVAAGGLTGQRDVEAADLPGQGTAPAQHLGHLPRQRGGEISEFHRVLRGGGSGAADRD